MPPQRNGSLVILTDRAVNATPTIAASSSSLLFNLGRARLAWTLEVTHLPFAMERQAEIVG